MDYRTCNITIDIEKQSPDIALGVDIGGAGDQGIMFGYACDETENYMPFAIDLAHKLAKRMEVVRKENIIKGLRPEFSKDVKDLIIEDFKNTFQCSRIDIKKGKDNKLYFIYGCNIGLVAFKGIPKEPVISIVINSAGNLFSLFMKKRIQVERLLM